MTFLLLIIIKFDEIPKSFFLPRETWGEKLEARFPGQLELNLSANVGLFFNKYLHSKI